MVMALWCPASEKAPQTVPSERAMEIALATPMSYPASVEVLQTVP